MNAMGQRTNVSQTGTAFQAARAIAWQYDSLGQVTSADSTENTHDRAYQFDTIGNRLFSEISNPQISNPPTATTTAYTANALNQYTAVNTVNPVHDPDGNATAYPLPTALTANSTLTWDAENRLIQTQLPNSGPTVQTHYDAQSRRIAETVGTTTTLFIYDGWNVISEYQLSNLQSPISHSKSHLWGLDLSGTLQGAGGVGGLLSTTQISQSPISNVTYVPTYDGNGNVSEYLDASGSITAHFEYDPFGNTVVNTDTGNQFAYRFSSKPINFATGLYYYAYRHYDPVTGRWPSRDPIVERGGRNLYGFVGNDGIGRKDRLGLVVVTESGWANENVRVERKAVSREYYHLIPTFETPYTSDEGKCMQQYHTHHMEVTKWNVYQYGLWFNAEADSQRDDNLALAGLMASAALANAPSPGTVLGGAVFLAIFYFSDKYLVTVDYEEQLHTLSGDTTYRNWITSFTRKLCDCACEYESCKSKGIPPVDAAEGAESWQNIYY